MQFKIKKGLLKENNFIIIWEDFLDFALVKGENQMPKQEIIILEMVWGILNIGLR